jgi:hypothetical protein
MLKIDMIYISSKVLVDEFKYSQMDADSFMTSFLFFAPLLSKPASMIGHAMDIDSCIKIALYRADNCLTRRCRKPYFILVDKLKQYKKDKNV